MTLKYNIMMRCQSGTTSLHDNPLRWKTDYHTITVCTEADIIAALASLAHFQPSFPWKGERSWIEIEGLNR